MKKEIATFAGGCFWCMVKPFDKQDGIIEVISGYTGGHVENPTYEQVCTELTGHREAVQITFNPDIYPYEKLVELYWTLIDPTDSGGQFFDRGESYKPAIYYHNEEQKQIAQKSKEELEKSGKFHKPIVVEILEAKPFYVAEDYHQYFYKKNPSHYKRYYNTSLRKEFREKYWGGQHE